MNEELTTRIESAVTEPASVSTDAGSATSKSISEKIEGIQFAEGRRAVASKGSGWGCLRQAKGISTGPV